MARVVTVAVSDWDVQNADRLRELAVSALEAGLVLHFPTLAFPLTQSETRFLDPAILHKAKNVSYNPANGKVGGTSLDEDNVGELGQMMQRYADASRALLHKLLGYGPALRRERTSLRPVEIAGRVSSWRKDDTRLHVDAFPSQPVQGRRILRIFCNVNPNGKPRVWRLGEPFVDVATRFWAQLPRPHWLTPHVFSLFRVTKGVRSDYDHYMLALHDAMKADESYQRAVDQETVAFAPGCAWACFTDQASHAALSGQHQFEQTFSLPVEAMHTPGKSPLRVLERLASRPLVAGSRRAA